MCPACRKSHHFYFFHSIDLLPISSNGRKPGFNMQFSKSCFYTLRSGACAAYKCYIFVIWGAGTTSTGKKPACDQGRTCREAGLWEQETIINEGAAGKTDRADNVVESWGCWAFGVSSFLMLRLYTVMSFWVQDTNGLNLPASINLVSVFLMPIVNNLLYAVIYHANLGLLTMTMNCSLLPLSLRYSTSAFRRALQGTVLPGHKAALPGGPPIAGRRTPASKHWLYRAPAAH